MSSISNALRGILGVGNVWAGLWRKGDLHMAVTPLIVKDIYYTWRKHLHQRNESENYQKDWTCTSGKLQGRAFHTAVAAQGLHQYNAQRILDTDTLGRVHFTKANKKGAPFLKNASRSHLLEWYLMNWSINEYNQKYFSEIFFFLFKFAHLQPGYNIQQKSMIARMNKK